MFDLLDGTPIHVLVVHAVIIIAPLTAIAMVLYALVAKWRQALQWPTVAGGVITGICGFVAGESGEQLEHRVTEGINKVTDPAVLQLVQTHTDAGDYVKMLCIGFMVLVLIAVLLLIPANEAKRRVPKIVSTVTVVVVIVASLAVIAGVYQAGHTGAKASWSHRV